MNTNQNNFKGLIKKNSVLDEKKAVAGVFVKKNNIGGCFFL